MGNNLTVSRQGGRTDVLLSVPEPELGLDGLVRFETFLEIVSEMICGFSALASHRLAFGGVLMLPVESVKAGYELLQIFLPFVRFEEDMSDFFLQLNRKRGDGEARVNELTKWNCLSFRRLVVAGDSVGQLDFDVHAVRIEFDINNPGLEQAVSGFEVISRLQDFINRAKRIASQGAA
ncbi:hypothetical protein N7381_09595 [Pseudomonas asiatica]|uniref:hypothetical protein n=1 Tax=Pseudomonas asiatica TaxID=2219225 RepID=UPI00244A9A50|nr:hypothetical protein [Pseudomonas asiatica]MDH0133498.1 hypothetical protein [Pseudomonas asiatica]